MKIAYIIECMHNSGGMERVLSVCANALCREVDITIITLCQKDRSTYFPLDNRIHCHDLDLEGVANRKLLKERMSEYIMAHYFDIVISLGGIDMYYLHSIKDRSKKVIWFHFAIDIAKTTWVGPHPSRFSKVKAQLVTWRRIYHARKYDIIVVISKADLNEWKKFANQVRLIYNPVTIDNPIISDLNAKAVISVGRLDFQKGFDFLIDAWKIVSEKHPDWLLDIYGEGTSREQLQRQINKYHLTSSISLGGRTDNIAEKYAQHSIYVMSSRAEGLGLVLLEAATCGLPLISFNCPSGPSEIIEEGENGILVDKVGDIQGLAKAINYLIENPDKRRRMGERAKDLNERFSEEGIKKQWLQLFNDLLM